MNDHLDAIALEVAAIRQLVGDVNVRHMNANEGHRLVELGDVMVHLAEIESHVKTMRREQR